MKLCSVVLLWSAFFCGAARSMNVWHKNKVMPERSEVNLRRSGQRYERSSFKRLEVVLAAISMTVGGTVATIPAISRHEKGEPDCQLGSLPRYNEAPCYVDEK